MIHMPKNKTMSTSDFYCTECGNKGIPIARLSYHQREPGHLKKLFCLHCQKETNHAEVRPKGQKYTYENFFEEYSLGRFINGNRIPVSQLPSCKKTDCLYNKHGRCWNSNNSYKCEVRK